MAAILLSLGVTQIIGYGTLYYSFAILVPAMAAEFAVSQSLLFAIFSAGFLLAGLAAPRLGRWMDLNSAPKAMVAGSVCAAAVCTGLALAPGIWSLGALLIALEFISLAVLYDAAFATLAGIAGATARTAITRLTLMAGFASTLFWPLTGYLVDAVGWRMSYAVFAVLHLLIALPLHAFVAAKAKQLHEFAASNIQVTSKRLFQPLADQLVKRVFMLVAVGFALQGFLISAIGVHLISILHQAGAAELTYIAAMLVGPAQVAVRIADAGLASRLHPLHTAVFSVATLPLALVCLALPLPIAAASIAFALLFGFGQGLSSIVRGTVPLALFGTTGFAERLGKLTAIRTMLAACAPFAFSLGVEGLGYSLTLWICVLIGVAALVPLFVVLKIVNQ